jgi:hypothetical protein
MACSRCSKRNSLLKGLNLAQTLSPGNSVKINGVLTLITTISLNGYEVTINGTPYSAITLS